MTKKEGKSTPISPAWWIIYGVLCGLGAAGLILLLAAPRRGQPIELLPAPSAESGQLEEQSQPTPTVVFELTLVFPININTATAAEFEQLPGIGPTLALSIVAYREAHGPFETLEDIQNVPDIGPLTFEAIQPFITLLEP